MSGKCAHTLPPSAGSNDSENCRVGSSTTVDPVIDTCEDISLPVPSQRAECAPLTGRFAGFTASLLPGHYAALGCTVAGERPRMELEPGWDSGQWQTHRASAGLG